MEEKDLPAILSLANSVLEKHVFPTLPDKGISTLLNSLNSDVSDILDKGLYQALKVEIGNKIVGYIAWRNGNYIAQLYVDSNYQRQGIGAMLVNEALKKARDSVLKVRASLNAVPFYIKYGFTSVGKESEINGIKFLPMEYKICKR